MSQHCIHEAATARLFFPLHEKEQIHAEFARSQQVRSCACDGEHRALVVRDTARIQVPITRGQLERVALPPLRGSRDYIIVPVRAYRTSDFCAYDGGDLAICISYP